MAGKWHGQFSINLTGALRDFAWEVKRRRAPLETIQTSFFDQAQ